MPLLSIHINPSKKLMLHKGNSSLCARQQYQRRHISEQKHFFALNECYKFLNDKNICVFVTIFSEEVSTNVPSLHGNSDWKLSNALTNNYLVTPSLYCAMSRAILNLYGNSLFKRQNTLIPSSKYFEHKLH